MPVRRPDDLVIAYIHPGQVSSYFTESLLQTVLMDFAAEATGIRPRRIVNILQEWSSANVSAARNTLTQRFLDQPLGEWLLWIDSDMQWEPDAVDMLLAAADPKERPIVGGLCFGMAGGDMYPTIYQFTEIDGHLTTIRVRDYPRDSVIRVAATGAAFVLIHRRALQQMAAKKFDRAFPFFAESGGNGKPVGEDITFCVRAGICGIPVYVHTGARIGHHKSRLLTEEEFLKQLPAGLPPGIGLVIPTRGDHPELLRAIIATSGLPPERVVVVDTRCAGMERDEDGNYVRRSPFTSEFKSYDVAFPEPPPLEVEGATVLVDRDPINIHRWWNAGIDLLAERGCTRVAVLNDDVIIAPETLPRMARALGSSTLAVLEDPYGVSGHCWLLNVTHGVRPDESYRWWCGDLQLLADAQSAGGVVTVPDAWCLHLHANESTAARPALTALAEEDGRIYDARFPPGSDFARDPDRTTPEELSCTPS